MAVFVAMAGFGEDRTLVGVFTERKLAVEALEQSKAWQYEDVLLREGHWRSHKTMDGYKPEHGILCLELDEPQ